MILKALLRVRASLVLATLGLLAVTGCGESGPEIVPVSGQVTIDGEPLTRGNIQVIPQGYRAASGKIGPDGRFTLTTYKAGDGVVRGTHQVAISSHENITPSQQKWYAPKTYLDPTKSGLEITISEPTSELQVPLTWNGGQPYIEKTGD